MGRTPDRPAGHQIGGPDTVSRYRNRELVYDRVYEFPIFTTKIWPSRRRDQKNRKGPAGAGPFRELYLSRAAGLTLLETSLSYQLMLGASSSSDRLW